MQHPGLQGVQQLQLALVQDGLEALHLLLPEQRQLLGAPCIRALIRTLDARNKEQETERLQKVAARVLQRRNNRAAGKAGSLQQRRLVARPGLGRRQPRPRLVMVQTVIVGGDGGGGGSSSCGRRL